MEERINIWDLWEKEWENASKFFQSKGNVKTRSKLKDQWYKEFKAMLINLETVITNNKLSQIEKELKEKLCLYKIKGCSKDDDNACSNCEDITQIINKGR